jgi:predicted RNase H-like HicB family nuclease
MAIRHYFGIAETGAENWSISFPDFPGTVTTGQNFAALMANARDALASVIEALQEDGATLPDSVETSAKAPRFDAAHYQNPLAVLVPVEVGGRALRINTRLP